MEQQQDSIKEGLLLLQLLHMTAVCTVIGHASHNL